MPTYNFKCRDCQSYERDIYYSLRDLPHVRPCSCGGSMEQDYSQHTVGYSDSGYPYTDPQTGLTYTSAANKQKQLREHGLEETSWKSGGMSISEQHKHEAWKQEKERARYEEQRDSNTSWVSRNDDQAIHVLATVFAY